MQIIMKKFTKSVLSLEVGPTLDRCWTDIDSMKSQKDCFLTKNENIFAQVQYFLYFCGLDILGMLNC